ncbi:hypothetical protein QJS04_geneDACA011501 [Acorus gramineus]|uniref:Transmembrane protein 18 n=1 Tax=Acorus gramineus TaxID=55184 RepID=A0AAV9A2U2_ACOGR|nr:hypothetical protein QJS04_geneDACA011501 [Acorus gramineus]
MGSAMEGVRTAMREHADLVADLFERLSTDLRRGFAPAYANFVGFFHVIDWTETWLICLMLFHATLLLITFISRKNVNFQSFLALMAFTGVYMAETINTFLAKNWQSFSGQNYFDPHGLFFSTLWSGPLLLISIVIVVNALFSLCHLIVKWKRAELRHRARLSQAKQK